MSSVLRFLKSRELYYGLARYALAALMMSFGMLKMLGMQFNTVRPFATWAQPLERLSGQQISWAFMGHSPVFQFILGVFEFVPALLLLFRRTTLVGALLLLPMTLGVFLVNFQMNLWTNTKLDAVLMLSANILILLLDGKRLRTMFLAALKDRKPNIAEVAVAVCVVALAVLPRLMSTHYRNDRNELTGDWFRHGAYAYDLISETREGKILPYHTAIIFFGPNGEYSEVNDAPSKSGAYKTYQINEAAKTLRISAEEYGPWRGSRYVLGGALEYSLSGDTLFVRDKATHSWSFVRRVLSPNRY